MNLQEYISSGILELYALGELSGPERQEVERNLAQYPELRDELSKVEAAQEAFLMASAIQPRSAVKTSLFEKIDSSSTVVKEATVVAMTPTETVSPFWRFAAAASVTIAVVASYFALDYRSRWQESQSSLDNLIAQNRQMASDYNTVSNKIDQIQNDIKVLNDPSFSRVVMVGTPNAKEALASVYWNQNTKEVYLSLQNMKELSRENQYQLWAIIDGKPVDAGVFDGNVAGLVKMKDIPQGATLFAVTIEPRGGKESPTLSTMQVAGEIKG